MPTYQYACVNAACGNEFELVQSFTDPAASECPVCGASVRKVYGSVGVVFKGPGFYRTDSRSSDKSSTKADSGSAGAAAFSGSKSTESSSSTSSPASTTTSTTTSSAPAPAASA